MPPAVTACSASGYSILILWNGYYVTKASLTDPWSSPKLVSNDPIIYNWTSIAVNGNTFIAITSTGKFSIYDENVNTWSPVTEFSSSSSYSNWISIVTLGTKFVAISSNGDYVIYDSGWGAPITLKDDTDTTSNYSPSDSWISAVSYTDTVMVISSNGYSARLDASSLTVTQFDLSSNSTGWNSIIIDTLFATTPVNPVAFSSNGFRCEYDLSTQTWGTVTRIYTNPMSGWCALSMTKALQSDGYFSSFDGSRWDTISKIEPSSYTDRGAWTSIAAVGTNYIAISRNGYFSVSTDWGISDAIQFDTSGDQWTRVISIPTIDNAAVAMSPSGKYAIIYNIGQTVYSVIFDSGYVDLVDLAFVNGLLIFIIENGYAIAGFSTSSSNTFDPFGISRSLPNPMIACATIRTKTVAISNFGQCVVYDEYDMVGSIFDDSSYFWNSIASSTDNVVALDSYGTIIVGTLDNTGTLNWGTIIRLNIPLNTVLSSITYNGTNFIVMSGNRQFITISIDANGAVTTTPLTPMFQDKPNYELGPFVESVDTLIAITQDGYYLTKYRYGSQSELVMSSAPIDSSKIPWRILFNDLDEITAVSDDGHFKKISYDYTTLSFQWSESKFIDSAWVAIQSDGTHIMALSAHGYISTRTGSNWSFPVLVDVSYNTMYWNAVASKAGKFVAISSNGYYFTYNVSSPTPIVQRFDTTDEWASITSNGNNFIAIATNGNYAVYNGTTWTKTTSSMPYRWYRSIASNGTQCIAINFNGYYMSGASSLTEASDQLTQSSIYDYWLSIASNGNTFVAISYKGYYAVYTNGWSSVEEITDRPYLWSVITSVGPNYVAISTNSCYYGIYNGSTWTVIRNPNIRCTGVTSVDANTALLLPAVNISASIVLSNVNGSTTAAATTAAVTTAAATAAAATTAAATTTNANTATTTTTKTATTTTTTVVTTVDTTNTPIQFNNGAGIVYSTATMSTWTPTVLERFEANVLGSSNIYPTGTTILMNCPPFTAFKSVSGGLKPSSHILAIVAPHNSIIDLSKLNISLPILFPISTTRSVILSDGLPKPNTVTIKLQMIKTTMYFNVGGVNKSVGDTFSVGAYTLPIFAIGGGLVRVTTTQATTTQATTTQVPIPTQKSKVLLFNAIRPLRARIVAQTKLKGKKAPPPPLMKQLKALNARLGKIKLDQCTKLVTNKVTDRTLSTLVLTKVAPVTALLNKINKTLGAKLPEPTPVIRKVTVFNKIFG